MLAVIKWGVGIEGVVLLMKHKVLFQNYQCYKSCQGSHDLQFKLFG